MYLLNDFSDVQFARKKGSKDKGKRTRRTIRNVAIGAGIIGAGALAGRKGGELLLNRSVAKKSAKGKAIVNKVADVTGVSSQARKGALGMIDRAADAYRNAKLPGVRRKGMAYGAGAGAVGAYGVSRLNKDKEKTGKFSSAEFARRKGSKDKQKRRGVGKSVGQLRAMKGREWAGVGAGVAAGGVGGWQLGKGLAMGDKRRALAGTGIALAGTIGNAVQGQMIRNRLRKEGYQVNEVNPFQKERSIRR